MIFLVGYMRGQTEKSGNLYCFFFWKSGEFGPFEKSNFLCISQNQIFEVEKLQKFARNKSLPWVQ